METSKPKPEGTPVQATDRALRTVPSPLVGPETRETVPPPSAAEPTIPMATLPPSRGPREPFSTLPDGVPSMLWEEAVESERYFAEPPGKPR